MTIFTFILFGLIIFLAIYAPGLLIKLFFWLIIIFGIIALLAGCADVTFKPCGKIKTDGLQKEKRIEIEEMCGTIQTTF